MMAIEQKLMTAEELFRLPDDGLRHELVKGKLRSMSPTGAEHGRIVVKVASSLESFVEANELGEVLAGEPGFQLTTHPDTVRAPDVAFIDRKRIPPTGLPRGYWQGAPDLAIEVVSPSDLYTVVDQKVAEWLEHGTRLVFVANPRRRTAAVHRPGQPVRIVNEDGALDGADVVPGWSLPLRDLFR